MSNKDIVKYWKDEEHRLNVSPEVRASLPENPAGLIELTDEALDDLVSGGVGEDNLTSSCGWSSCNSSA